MAVKFGSGAPTGTPLISGTTGIVSPPFPGMQRALLSFWFQYTGPETALTLAKFTGPDIEVIVQQTDQFSGTVLTATLKYNGSTIDTLYFHNFPSGRLTIGDWYHLAIFIDANTGTTKLIPIKVYFGSTLADSGTPSTGQQSVIDYNITDIEMVERNSTTYDVVVDRLYVGLKSGTANYNPSDYYISPPQFYLNFYDSLGRAAILGDDNLQDEFTDDIPYYWLTDSGTNFGINDSNCSGNNLSVNANATTITGPDSHNLLSSGTISLNSQSQLSVSTTFGVFGSSNINANSQIIESSGVIKGITETLLSTTKATDFTDVTDYVETEEALYVDAGYHDDGYVENDPYVAQGYVGEEIGLSAQVDISAELDVTGQGAVTISAKATLASEVDFATQTTMSVSAGLIFNQATNIAADAQASIDAGLIFNQATALDTDFQFTSLAGSLIQGNSNLQSDVALTADADVTIGGIVNISSDAQISILGGYLLDAESDLASDTVVNFTAEVLGIATINAVSETDITAQALLSISAELDVTGQGAVSVVAKATTGSDVELSGDFQFTAIGTVAQSAETDLLSQSTLQASSGLQFVEEVELVATTQSTQLAGLIVDIDDTLESTFATNQTGILTLGGFSSIQSDFTVTDVEPSLIVGPIINIFQGTSIVAVLGTYLYDVPLIRRLTIPAEVRIGNILQESRILDVKSESRINTVITETRGLIVSREDRIHKIYDGSL